MPARTALTPREQALLDVINTLLFHVEELGCTCANGDDKARRHEQGGRRRRDSACTGVALAVEADLKLRRVLRRAR